MNRDSRNKYTLVSVERAIAILEAFSYQKPELSFTEICEIVGLKKASAKRLLVTLEENRLLRRTENGKYMLGSQLVKLGHLASQHLTLLRIGEPEVHWLRSQTGETVILVEWTGSDQSYLAKVEGSGHIRVASTVGTRRMAHYGLGKTIMAFLPPEEVNVLLPDTLPSYTNNTITSKTLFLEELATIRQRGYAVDNEEYIPGVIGIGAPIFKRDGKVCGFIGVLTPRIVNLPALTEQIAVVTLEAAEHISHTLGFETESPAK